MRLQTGRVGQEHEGDGLGDLFGKGIVEDERVITRLGGRYIVSTLGDPIRLTLANPLDRLETNGCQLLDDGGLLVPGGARVGGRSGEVLGRVGALGIGGGQMRAQTGLAGVLEDSKVYRLLVRLNTPGDGMVGADVDPSYEVRLLARERLGLACAHVRGGPIVIASYLAMDLQLLHCRHDCADKEKRCQEELREEQPSRSGGVAAEGEASGTMTGRDRTGKDTGLRNAKTNIIC